MSEIHGWGRYPRIEAESLFPLSADECVDAVIKSGRCIPRGLARSYGDSSLAAWVLDTRYLNHFLSFDDTTGVLTCDSGVSLSEILRVFVPRGWFLPVLPGTRFVTVGGAIASDIHGKNHHHLGTFSRHVRSVEILLGNGERLTISREKDADLFYATCGGMGLTGLILSAAIQLKPILGSEIVQTTLKAPNLEAVLQAFEDNAATTYSVAWIDCLARGKHLGRSLLILGEHADDGQLAVKGTEAVPIPFDMPAGLLNSATVKAFNWLFYEKVLKAKETRRIPFEQFFFPLDKLANWNRLYGKDGFVQYQVVLPKAVGVVGLRNLLQRIADSGLGSFLAVLKLFGEANKNHLSFAMNGYTLALDFKVEPAVFELLSSLDRVVLEHGGRLYLSKDARMTEATFKASYPRWQEFEEVRAKYHATEKFASLQSRRLGLG